MKIVATDIPGVIIFEPRVFDDDRGFFVETFRQDWLVEAGLDVRFVQDNQSRSWRGVLRGLHYQLVQPQGKLVRVARGRIFDVAVDVRRGSPTFGRWYGAYLDDRNHRQLYLPPGFAHGFAALSEVADIVYKCTDYYHPESETGIRWDDPDLAIAWPAEIAGAARLSAKDLGLPRLGEQTIERLPGYTKDSAPA